MHVISMSAQLNFLIIGHKNRLTFGEVQPSLGIVRTPEPDKQVDLLTEYIKEY